MKFVCLGCLDEKQWETFSATDQLAVVDECIAYDDVLRKKGEKGAGNPEAPPENKSVTFIDKLWKYLYNYTAKHKAKGNGSGYGMVNKTGVARTLSARYYKDGSEILVSRGKGNPRRLTPRECARLMGYPDNFRIPVSDTQAYKQFGNSVVVPVVEAVAKIMKPHIMALKEEEEAKVHQYALMSA